MGTSLGISVEVAQEGIFAGTLEVGRAQGTLEGTLLEVAGRAACTAAAAETSFWSLRI